jgi:hypothetical protein
VRTVIGRAARFEPIAGEWNVYPAHQRDLNFSPVSTYPADGTVLKSAAAKQRRLPARE